MGDILDSVGMFDLAAALPEQVAAAALLAADVEGLPDHDDVENVVVMGMGGSGIPRRSRRSRRPAASLRRGHNEETWARQETRPSRLPGQVAHGQNETGVVALDRLGIG